jgi:hypothetical protein
LLPLSLCPPQPWREAAGIIMENVVSTVADMHAGTLSTNHITAAITRITSNLITGPDISQALNILVIRKALMIAANHHPAVLRWVRVERRTPSSSRASGHAVA